jgi:hypothetical protein
LVITNTLFKIKFYFFLYQDLNTEEELLQWEPTQCPILQTMLAYKEPYEKLWKTALSFNNKHEAWLNGTFTIVRVRTTLMKSIQPIRQREITSQPIKIMDIAQPRSRRVSFFTVIRKHLL